MREDICYRYTFCPMCPLSAYLCPADHPFGGFRAIPPPDAEQRGRLTPLRPSAIAQGPSDSSYVRIGSDPAWGRDLRDWPRGSDQLASDHPVEAIVEAIGEAIAHWPASGLRLLAVGPRRWVFNLRGFSFRPVGFPSDSQREAGDAW